MANEFKHRQTTAGTGGDELSQSEWEATDTHEADGETTNDMLYFDGTTWIRATQATIAGLIDSEIKLDDLKAPDDNTDLNASTSKHGLMLKLDNNSSNFLNGQGAWATPPGGVDTGGTPVANDIARFTDADTIEGRSYSEFKADLDLEIGTDILAEQTIGIADDNLLEVDDAGPAAVNDYCKLTANGIAGRTYAEVKTDLSLNNVENTAHSTDSHTMTIDGRDVSADGTKLDNVVSNTQAITHAITDNKTVTVDGTTNVPVNGDYAKWTANGVEGMSKAQMLSDLNVADGADVTGSNAPQAHASTHDSAGSDQIHSMADDDDDTKIQVEESADEDIVRIDTAGAEAFHLSAIGVLTLAKQSGARGQPTVTHQVIPDSTSTKVRLSGEDFDIQNELNITVKSGAADATEANKLHDADGGFASSDVGAWIWNTTDDTYTTVSAFVDSGELTLAADIMVDTETYELYHSLFTATEAGYYLVVGHIYYQSPVADKFITAYLKKNGATDTIGRYHTSNITTSSTNAVAVLYLAVSDYVELYTYHSCVVNETIAADHSTTLSVTKLA